MFIHRKFYSMAGGEQQGTRTDLIARRLAYVPRTPNHSRALLPDTDLFVRLFTSSQ